eukprot:CAMPEP_0170539036 /NCGR_PEP_ID=MMETSP0209-20121228/103671_1 /TAXON_ID=665100 ORGANISM="Litonotus pictus, Strain P1" /NCGR_SAMPLE_ID=MMETSP0209 /ASSEMBLY_ACC=CAM_ASM_000301 /LENGTH=1443 /DNA_ID=CAMNT_0010840857 /DNA_START=1058 /DNA_END=5390 /DNA_ORIENTATION=-
MDMKEDKRESGILIKGFIRNHESNCYINDCPLKVIKRNMDNNYNDFSIYGSFMMQQMLLFINRIYLLGISKYPNSATLRISFSLFLYYNQKQKMKAKQELENAEKCSLSFSQQFLIFRFKKLIIEDLDTNQNHTEVLDIANSIAYESHFRQCQQDILSAARLFLEFWTLLASQNISPDIAKLNELSLKVNDTIKNIHNHWKRMQYYKPNDPKALKLYASLYIELMNNKEKGKEILALSKETADKKNLLTDHYDYLMIDEDFSSGNCVIICSAENDNYGALLKASSNACKIFGYLTEDLINGRPIDDLFLDCYNGGVANFIQDISSCWGEEISKKEFFLFSKTKQHKTVPVYLKLIDPNKTIGDKIHTKIMIRPEDNINEELKDFTRSCYFIINNNLNISVTSESASELVSLIYGNKTMLTEISTITYIFPELYKNFRNIHNNFIFPELYKNFDKNELFGSYNHQYNSNKLSDTVLYDLINDNNTSYQDLDIYLKTIQVENWINNNTTVTNNEFDDKVLKIKLKLTKIELNSYLSSKEDKAQEDNQFYGSFYKTKGDKTGGSFFGSSNYNTKTASINVVDNNYNKETFFAIKIRYEFSSKLSKFRSNESYIAKNPGTPDNQNQTPHMTPTNKNTPAFNTHHINNPYLSLNFEKLLKEVNSKNTNSNNCLMNYIRDKNNSFSAMFAWEGLDGNRFLKKDQLTHKTGGTQLEALEKGKPNVSGLSKSFERKSNDSHRDNNQFKSETERINNYNSSEENELEEEEDESENENPEEYYMESEEEVENILREEIESGFKRDGLYEKIKVMRNYCKNVRCYIMKNDKDPIEDFAEPKLLEYATLLNTSGPELDDQSSRSQTTGVSFKGPKEQTDIKPPASLEKLQISSLIVILILVIYAIVELILNIRTKDSLLTNFEMTYYSYQMINEAVWSTYLLRNLLIIREDPKFTIQDTNFNKNITLLEQSIDDQNYYIKNLTKNDLSLEKDHDDIISNEVVPLYKLDSYTKATEYRTLRDAMSQMRSTLMSILQTTRRDSIVITNTFVMNYMYNSLNDYVIFLRRNAIYFVDLVFTNTDFYKILEIIYYCLLVILLFIFTYIMYLFLSKVYMDRTKILFAFYEIPPSYLNKLSELCLKFVEKYEKPDNEGSDKASESNLEADEETAQMKLNKRKISHQSFFKSQKIYLLKISMTFTFLLVFFSVNFGKNIQMLSTTKEINSIYNTTLQMQSLMNFALNLEKEKIVDETTEVLKNEGILLINNTINQLYALNNNLFVQHLGKKWIFSDTYIYNFKVVIHDDLCKFPILFQDEQECKNQLNYIGKYGFEVVIMKYFENLHNIFLKDIKRIVKEENPIAALNSRLVQETNKLMHYFIKPCSRYLVEEMRKEISDYLQAEFDFKLIVFILFLVFTLLIFLIFWLPFQNNLHDEILRTKKMLEIIPSSILNEMEFLKEI